MNTHTAIHQGLPHHHAAHCQEPINTNNLKFKSGHPWNSTAHIKGPVVACSFQHCQFYKSRERVLWVQARFWPHKSHSRAACGNAPAPVITHIQRP